MNGQLLRLREWGSDRFHLLSADAFHYSLGSDEECGVRISDKGVSPLHAHLSRDRRQWTFRALGESAKVWRDGMPASLFEIEPGMEIRVGGTTLIAEDDRWIALRSFCERLIGWESVHIGTVDRALRSIRLSMSHRVPLLLRGDADMIPIARALHQRVLGAQPFIVCDPRRGRRSASVRSPASVEAFATAAHEASGGSVCVRSLRLLPTFATLHNWLTAMRLDVQLIFGVDSTISNAVISEPIEVRSLATRVADLPRIIDEYALDAIAALGATPDSFTIDDHRWVLAYAVKSLSEIEKATLRCVALRSCKAVSRAAARLGMAPVSLSRWLALRSGGRYSSPQCNSRGV